MQSSDGGRSWPSFNPEMWGIVRIFWQNEAEVWLVTNFTQDLADPPGTRFGYLLHTIDGGKTWRQIPESWPAFANPRDMYAAPEGRVWLAGAGVAVSRDEGNTWDLSLKSVGLVNRIVTFADTLLVVSQRGEGDGQLGIFRLRPGQTKWDVLQVPLWIAGGLSAALDDHGRLLVGTAGTGVWRMEW